MAKKFIAVCGPRWDYSSRASSKCRKWTLNIAQIPEEVVNNREFIALSAEFISWKLRLDTDKRAKTGECCWKYVKVWMKLYLVAT